MSTENRSPRSRSATMAARSAWAVAFVSGIFGALGCARDNRISWSEFAQRHPVAVPSAEVETEAPATQPSATQPAMPVADAYFGPYLVGPGDVLGFSISGIEQATGAAPLQARVDRDGNIDMPFVGAVQVAGMELQDVEKAVRAAYVPSVYRQASVHAEVLKPDAVSVLVAGAVTQPGLVQLSRSQRNLLHAIAAAGGVSNIAGGEVTLRRLRNPEASKSLNLLQPAQLQEALVMEPLRNGDVVVVQAAAANAVFVGGLVNVPHIQVNPPGTEMNVLQAIASAGGLRTDLTIKDLTLIRRMSDGKDAYVKLDLARIRDGIDPNFALAAGDILWASDTWQTRTEDWINKNIFFRAGFNVVGTYSVEGVDYINNNAKRSSLGNNNVQNTVDPLGFLTRQQQLNQLPNP